MVFVLFLFFKTPCMSNYHYTLSNFEIRRDVTSCGLCTSLWITIKRVSSCGDSIQYTRLIKVPTHLKYAIYQITSNLKVGQSVPNFAKDDTAKHTILWHWNETSFLKKLYQSLFKCFYFLKWRGSTFPTCCLILTLNHHHH